MKKWNFRIIRDSKEISEKLESSFGGRNKFAFKMDSERDNLVKFSIRRRLLLAFELISQNNLVVNGKIHKARTGRGTEVEISFALHPFAKFLLYGHLLLGLGLLAALTLESGDNTYFFILGGILLATGFLFWLHLRKIGDQQVQEYKTLISEILEF